MITIWRTHETVQRLVIAAGVCLIIANADADAGLAQETSNKNLGDTAPATKAVDQLETSVNQAIRFLITKQREDGAIIDRQYDTTMTSLAIMAMASTGITPSQNDQRGICMRRALDFVLRRDRQDEDGYYGNRDGSRMYGHGISTLMLTEMLGMGANAEQDRLIHTRCQKAIDLILSAQKQSKPTQFRGGWRYSRHPR